MIKSVSRLAKKRLAAKKIRRKRLRYNGTFSRTGDKIDNIIESVVNKARSGKESITDAAVRSYEKTKEGLSSAKENVKNFGSKTKDNVKDTKDKIKDRFSKQEEIDIDDIISKARDMNNKDRRAFKSDKTIQKNMSDFKKDISSGDFDVSKDKGFFSDKYLARNKKYDRELYGTKKLKKGRIAAASLAGIGAAGGAATALSRSNDIDDKDIVQMLNDKISRGERLLSSEKRLLRLMEE